MAKCTVEPPTPCRCSCPPSPSSHCLRRRAHRSSRVWAAPTRPRRIHRGDGRTDRRRRRPRKPFFGEASRPAFCHPRRADDSEIHGFIFSGIPPSAATRRGRTHRARARFCARRGKGIRRHRCSRSGPAPPLRGPRLRLPRGRAGWRRGGQSRGTGGAARPIRSTGRMGVISVDDVMHRARGEEQFRRHAAPQRAAHVAMLHPAQQRVLDDRRQFANGAPCARAPRRRAPPEPPSRPRPGAGSGAKRDRRGADRTSFHRSGRHRNFWPA